jgi:hypothetical protein
MAARWAKDCRATFDEVARLSVERKSAIDRVKRIDWNAVARWLETAAHVCRRFNARKIAALSVAEKIKSGQSTVSVIVDDGNASLAS